MIRRRCRVGLGLSAILFATVAAHPARVGHAADDAVERLSEELAEILGQYSWRAARWAVLVVSLDRGDTLFATRADSALAPASNMKLLTSAAALRQLGPSFQFRTWLLSEGAIAQGVLEGDLVLYGTGDPGISDRFYPEKETVFQELADQLVARGITRVNGDLVGDASFLSGPLRPPGWDPGDLNDHFAAAVSALSFNENVVTLRVEAAERSGQPPAVLTLPDHAGLAVDNQAVTTEGPGNLLMVRDDPMQPVAIRGGLQRGGRGAWREITVSEPAAFALSVFRAVLESRGVQVAGGTRVVDAPRESALGRLRIAAPSRAPQGRVRVLATHVSPTLREYLAVVNKKSNNLYAELLFRTLARVTLGVGSPEAGTAAVAASLGELGVDLGGLVQLDGSGLSEGNRVRPTTFVDLLARMAESPDWPEYWASLPVAGNRRELGRMYNTAAAGNLRAKTGTIQGVSALSGVVQTQDGERLAFSILVNGTPSTTRAKRVENDIGVRLASFTRGSDALSLAAAGRLPPPPIPVDSGGPSRHRVARGETLESIAHRYHLTVDELRRANPGVTPNRLRAGSWVAIPASGSG
ncbi:MAG: D-alanyl-D-alanine carboxypeptidase/D-alanyl-D-alanine-endopeptidase, partial [Gemmatimonadetes bacterium]|nr:D-alanyl-D-alanine carboxypeptidase/D-alanyl-D-alanine-endopeptidase [Gemmatimonadota bacterium]